jgi:hypothetical protein
MSVLVFFSVVFLFVFCLKEHKKIDNFIGVILKNKFRTLNNNNKPNIKDLKVNKTKMKKNNKSRTENKTKLKKGKNKKEKGNNLKSKSKTKKNDNPPKKKKVAFKINKKKILIEKNCLNSKENLKNIIPRNNGTNINIVKINNFNVKKIKKIQKIKKGKPENIKPKKKRQNKEKSQTISPSKSRKKLALENKDVTSIYSATSNALLNLKAKCKEMNIKDINNNNLYKNLNDEEINALEYEIAIVIDKRTYFQYYWSLLKKNN